MSVFVKYCHERGRYRWPILLVSVFLFVTIARNIRLTDSTTSGSQQRSLLQRLRNLPNNDDILVSEELEGMYIPGSPVVAEGLANRISLEEAPRWVGPNFRARVVLDINERYLFYPRSGDWCKGVGHVRQSLRCALAEARHLNRTLLLDEDFCIRVDYNTGQKTLMDFRRYWDLKQIMWHVKIAPLQRFVRAWGDWNSAHEEGKIHAKHVDRLALSETLYGDPAPIILRSFTVGKEEYAYDVCNQEGNGKVLVDPVLSLPLFAAALVEIGKVIIDTLGGQFKAIHIQRGEKLGDKARWPSLEEDTQAAHILAVMKTRWPAGQQVYVATDERTAGHFAAVRKVYRLVMLPDFAHLWVPGSRWWKRYNEETYGPGERAAEIFDETMQAVVDHVVFMAAQEKLETFNDFTQDPEAGLLQSKKHAKV